MSLAENINERMGHRMYHVDKVVIDKDSILNGEDAIEVKAIINKEKLFIASYLKRNHMTHEDIADNFTKKIDSILRGTAEEL